MAHGLNLITLTMCRSPCPKELSTDHNRLIQFSQALYLVSLGLHIAPDAVWPVLAPTEVITYLEPSYCHISPAQKPSEPNEFHPRNFLSEDLTPLTAIERRIARDGTRISPLLQGLWQALVLSDENVASLDAKHRLLLLDRFGAGAGGDFAMPIALNIVSHADIARDGSTTHEEVDELVSILEVATRVPPSHARVVRIYQKLSSIPPDAVGAFLWLRELGIRLHSLSGIGSASQSFDDAVAVLLSSDRLVDEVSLAVDCPLGYLPGDIFSVYTILRLARGLEVLRVLLLDFLSTDHVLLVTCCSIAGNTSMLKCLISHVWSSVRRRHRSYRGRGDPGATHASAKNGTNEATNGTNSFRLRSCPAGQRSAVPHCFKKDEAMTAFILPSGRIEQVPSKWVDEAIPTVLNPDFAFSPPLPTPRLRSLRIATHTCQRHEVSMLLDLVRYIATTLQTLALGLTPSVPLARDDN